MKVTSKSEFPDTGAVLKLASSYISIPFSIADDKHHLHLIRTCTFRLC